jgi:signal transduction histidine kinase/ActR/RegA family two-component response regulator
MSPVRRAEPIGALGVYWAATRTATTEEVRLVEALADVASIAVQNARLFEEVAASNQAKDEFLAMLAHELRNPLAPIRNAVAVLRMIGADDPTTNRARELIDRQVAHMTRLVDDLLDVSRITRGKIALRTEEVALRTIVEEAVEATRPLVDEHGHTLALALPDPGVRLDADRARLVQVIANLLTNAAKFTPDGGHIAVAAERSASGHAVVRIRDTGIGIGPEMQRRVFDLFAQEDGSVARARGGLGIGLTLVKQLVELHGGHVAVASEGRDRGTEFTVTLPALGASADAAHPAPRDTTDAGVGPLRIMVVEDNPDTAESFGLLLRLSGHDVRVMPRAVDALRLLDEFVADVAFLDIGLPGMDGFELARRLRTDPRVQSMVLVALTGYGRDEDRDEARRAGFDHHMTKPVDIDQLLALLNAVAPAARPARVVH